jgi:hypothetical protein
VRDAGPGKSVAVPLGVLAQLVSNGVPVEKATTIVVRFVSEGQPQARLIALGEKVESDVGAGIPAEAALDLRAKGLQVQTGRGSGLVTETADALPPALTSGTNNGTGGSRGATPSKKPKRP